MRRHQRGGGTAGVATEGASHGQEKRSPLEVDCHSRVYGNVDQTPTPGNKLYEPQGEDR